jgi:hypothetical protein
MNLKKSGIAILAFALSLFSQKCMAQGPLTNWNLVYSAPAPLTGVAYGNGTFVGVGGGLRFVSHDGSNWVQYETAPIIYGGAVAYGNGMFMAYGTNTQYRANYIVQSTNGIQWSVIYSSSNTLAAAAYGNNTWVFIGTNEIVTATLTGTNLAWTDFQPSFMPIAVSYINGNFLLTGLLYSYPYGPPYPCSIYSSVDGLIWQYLSALPNYSYSSVSGLAYNNGVYAITLFQRTFADYYYSCVFASSNLTQWTLVLSNFTGLNPDYYNLPIVTGGNQFVTSPGPFNSTGGSIFSSLNGYSWSPPFGATCNAITYGQGTFVGCGPAIYQSGLVSTQSSSNPNLLSISTYAGVTITGAPGGVYQIQYATNLNSVWAPLTNFMLPYSPYLWFDTSSPVVGKRFYRSVQLQ